MTRLSWLAAGAAAIALTACAQTGADSSSAQALSAQPTQNESWAGRQDPATGQASGQSAAPSQATPDGEFSDDQLHAFLAAHAEIEPISRSLAAATPDQRAQATAQISTILERHNLSPDAYNAVAQRASTDQVFATRLAGLRHGDFSDVQLQAFVRAATEIDPINRRLATATPDQRAQAATQIGAILQRNNLDAATYNAIATRAQTDTALAARIDALQAPASPGEGE